MRKPLTVQKKNSQEVVLSGLGQEYYSTRESRTVSGGDRSTKCLGSFRRVAESMTGTCQDLSSLQALRLSTVVE